MLTMSVNLSFCEHLYTFCVKQNIDGVVCPHLRKWLTFDWIWFRYKGNKIPIYKLWNYCQHALHTGGCLAVFSYTYTSLVIIKRKYLTREKRGRYGFRTKRLETLKQCTLRYSQLIISCYLLIIPIFAKLWNILSHFIPCVKLYDYIILIIYKIKEINTCSNNVRRICYVEKCCLDIFWYL